MSEFQNNTVLTTYDLDRTSYIHSYTLKHNVGEVGVYGNNVHVGVGTNTARGLPQGYLLEFRL